MYHILWGFEHCNFYYLRYLLTTIGVFPTHIHIIISGSGYLHPLTYISYKVDCPNRLSWKMINLGVKAFTSGNQVIDLDNFPSIPLPGSELWHLKNHFPRHQFVYRCGGNDCRNMFLRWEGSLAGVRVFESWWIRNQFPTHQSRKWKKTMRMKTKSTNESIRRLNARVRSWDGCSVPSWICVNCIYIVFPTRYRPQTKFAKVMFLQASVCPQGGACVSHDQPVYKQVHSCWLSVGVETAYR